jgi:hypothetical protein
METESESIKEDNKIYIQLSKQNIDYYIRNNEYQKAFSLLIHVLERLDINEKEGFIEYYSKKLNQLFIGRRSHLDFYNRYY